jgi:hypothetical protein
LRVSRVKRCGDGALRLGDICSLLAKRNLDVAIVAMLPANIVSNPWLLLLLVESDATPHLQRWKFG